MLVVLRKIYRLGGSAGLVVEYVINTAYINNIAKFLNIEATILEKPI